MTATDCLWCDNEFQSQLIGRKPQRFITVNQTPCFVDVE